MWTGWQYEWIVRDFYLDQCDALLKAAVRGRYLRQLQLGGQVEDPISKELRGGDGINELIPKTSTRRKIARLLFYVDEPGKRLVFVDAFIKETTIDYQGRIAMAQHRREQVATGLARIYPIGDLR